MIIVGVVLSIVLGVVLGCLSANDRVEYLRELEARGATPDELWDAAMSLDC